MPRNDRVGVSLRAPTCRGAAISLVKFQIPKALHFKSKIRGLSLNIPLKIRGIKGVISLGHHVVACSASIAFFITPPPAKEFVRRAGLTPLILRGAILRREILEKFGEIQMLKYQTYFFSLLGFELYHLSLFRALGLICHLSFGL